MYAVLTYSIYNLVRGSLICDSLFRSFTLVKGVRAAELLSAEINFNTYSAIHLDLITCRATC